MTVSYNFDVSSTTSYWSMTRILFRWRGSVWKAVVPELILWCFLFAVINVNVRYNLNDAQIRYYKTVRDKLGEHIPRIPLVFLLGFFVSVVFNRWNEMFSHIGFIDNLALTISVGICGAEPETKILKRNIVRYTVLSQALVLRDISIRVRKRFPTIESLGDAGLMSETEVDLFKQKQMHNNNKYWLPQQWALRLVAKAREREKISSDVIMWNCMQKILEFRTHLERLCCYDWVPVPMSYPQIAILAVRLYFFVQLFARQTLPIDNLDIYVPYMTLIELTLLVGWLKVAEAILNPFGEDDDDFECNFVIDRNLSTGLEIVNMQEAPPADRVDPFWQMAAPKPLDDNDDDGGGVSGGGVFGSARASSTRRRAQPYHGSVAELCESSCKSGALFSVYRRRRQLSALAAVAEYNDRKQKTAADEYGNSEPPPPRPPPPTIVNNSVLVERNTIAAADRRNTVAVDSRSSTN